MSHDLPDDIAADESLLRPLDPLRQASPPTHLSKTILAAAVSGPVHMPMAVSYSRPPSRAPSTPSLWGEPSYDPLLKLTLNPRFLRSEREADDSLPVEIWSDGTGSYLTTHETGHLQVASRGGSAVEPAAAICYRAGGFELAVFKSQLLLNQRNAFRPQGEPKRIALCHGDRLEVNALLSPIDYQVAVSRASAQEEQQRRIERGPTYRVVATPISDGGNVEASAVSLPLAPGTRILVGPAPKCDWQLPCGGVNDLGIAAVLEYHDGLCIRPYDPGLFVNGEWIAEYQRIRLRDGARVRFQPGLEFRLVLEEI